MKLNVVPPRTGLAWVRLGIRTFWSQPLALVGLFLMYSVTMLLLWALPVVGPVLATLLAPAASLGLMAGAAEAVAGRFPFPTVLVAGFRAGRDRTRSMLMLGALWSLASVILLAIAGLLPDTPLVQVPAPEGAAGELVTLLDTRTIAVLLLNLPFLLLFWFAPALVHWHGVRPVQSLFYSAVACWRNLGAIVVFGLAWVGVFLAVGTLVGVFVGLLFGPTVAKAAIGPAALLLMSVASTSVYFTFRDSFSADPVPGTPPPSDGAST